MTTTPIIIPAPAVGFSPVNVRLPATIVPALLEGIVTLLGANGITPSVPAGASIRGINARVQPDGSALTTITFAGAPIPPPSPPAPPSPPPPQ